MNRGWTRINAARMVCPEWGRNRGGDGFAGLGLRLCLVGLGDPSLAFRVLLAVGWGAGRAGWDGEDAEQALGAPRGRPALVDLRLGGWEPVTGVAGRAGGGGRLAWGQRCGGAGWAGFDRVLAVAECYGSLGLAWSVMNIGSISASRGWSGSTPAVSQAWR